MKRILIISVLFLLAFMFSPKTTFAKKDECPADLPYSFCRLTTDMAPNETCRNTGVCTGFTSRVVLWCCASDKDEPVPVIFTEGPLRGCEGTAINTAIGCIPIGDTDEFIGFILRWAIGIGGGIAFLLIVFAGFQIMTSAGNPERLQAGRELLTSAIAGLILLIFSVFILRIIGVNILGIFKP